MKKLISKILVFLRFDSIFRRINNGRLLVVAYHGVCARQMCPPLFTQLPVDVFIDQLHFLKKHYKIISLNELLLSLEGKKPFRERTALITFDDGFMNNYKVAFPVLKELNIPATIFLTVDYIGTENLLWFDELFLLVKQALDNKIDLSIFEKDLAHFGAQNNITEIYSVIAEELKKMSHENRIRRILSLKSKINLNTIPMAENFKLLTWEQVKEMKASGLIDFGVHTATHRVLSQLQKHELEKELLLPKEKLAQILDCDVSAFCYPNGIPDVDFTVFHERYLKQVGYLYSFCTGEYLNSRSNNRFRLGRIPAGNDMTSDKNYFRLNTSGFIEEIKKLTNKYK